MRNAPIWYVKDINQIIRKRQLNQFDSNISVTGNRGDGKSTLIGKVAYRMECFDPWIHQVYSRPDVIKLLKTQRFGICWDDEAINSSYRRTFYEKGQHELIKILTAYRDNFNVYASAIPNFFSLDKDLRDLYFIHLHVIERGIAVVHMPLQGMVYSQDRWDAKNNSKIEESWSKKNQNNPNFKPPYHKLSTFRGYLYFNKLTHKQEELYKEIKKFKRNRDFQTAEEKKANLDVTFIDRIYKLLIDGKLSKEGLIQSCLIEGKKYSSINQTLNKMLTDNGEIRTVTDFLRESDKKPIHNKNTHEINTLLGGI